MSVFTLSGVPMQQHPFVMAASLVFTISAAFWFLAVRSRGHASSLEAEGAVTATIIGAMCLVAWGLRKRDDERRRQIAEEYARREAAIIKTAAYAALARTTGPIPTPPFPVQRPYVVR